MIRAYKGKNSTIFIAITCFLIATNTLAKDIKISGDLMLDHDSFESGFLEDENESGTERFSKIRRANISIKTKLMDDWKAKLKVDFSGDSTEIKDAYIKYQGWDWADVTIGQQKEGFGLEKLVSSRDTLMIERSLVTTALTPGRSLGVSVTGGSASYNWQLGYYQPDESESATAVTGRLAWLPWRQGNELVHLGVAFSERDLNGSDFRINEKMEVYLADSLIEGEKLLADKSSLQGIEFLWQQAGFTTMAEWQQATVTDINNTDYDYQGGYVQFSYQLSGDNRKYKNGELGSVTTPGWEFTSRYSQFELIEESREAQVYSLGVNYTVNEHLKFMADYIKAKQLEVSNESDFSDAVSLRVQYAF
ncbi:porin [Colwellia sp. MB02u-10]|jgi:phosphate-selective porin OprO/OprP|nr:porin [Colwellia sp. MB02u-10]